jgi:hypothetical protein
MYADLGSDGQILITTATQIPVKSPVTDMAVLCLICTHTDWQFQGLRNKMHP